MLAKFTVMCVTRAHADTVGRPCTNWIFIVWNLFKNNSSTPSQSELGDIKRNRELSGALMLANSLLCMRVRPTPILLVVLAPIGVLLFEIFLKITLPEKLSDIQRNHDLSDILRLANSLGCMVFVLTPKILLNWIMELWCLKSFQKKSFKSIPWL